MHKRNWKRFAAGLLLALTVLMGLAGCDLMENENNYKEDTDIAISGEPTSLVALEDAMKEVACQYDTEEGNDELQLVEAMAIYDGDQDLAARLGDLYYTFYRYDEEQKKAVTVILQYDMDEQKVVKVSYKKNAGTLSEEDAQPIPDVLKAMRFEDIFDQLLTQDESFHSKLTKGENIKLTLEFTAKTGLEASLI